MIIETLYPKSTKDIIEYDVLKLAAVEHIENVMLELVKIMRDNAHIQTMRPEMLSVVSRQIFGTEILDSTILLDKMNNEESYTEKRFSDDFYSWATDERSYYTLSKSPIRNDVSPSTAVFILESCGDYEVAVRLLLTNTFMVHYDYPQEFADSSAANVISSLEDGPQVVALAGDHYQHLVDTLDAEAPNAIVKFQNGWVVKDYTMMLISYGTAKVAAVQAVRDVTGLGLRDASALVNATDISPQVVTDGISAEGIDNIRTAFANRNSDAVLSFIPRYEYEPNTSYYADDLMIEVRGNLQEPEYYNVLDVHVYGDDVLYSEETDTMRFDDFFKEISYKFPANIVIYFTIGSESEGGVYYTGKNDLTFHIYTEMNVY